MPNTAYAWAPITKVEDQEDGTLMVYGPMTDAGLDRDRQGLNQVWLDGAVPAWMKEGANVREQHDPKRAVAVGVQLERRTDGTFDLGTHVVDPVAVAKVRAGVLKGYSVGIKDPQINFGKTEFPAGEIVGGSIIEVSLVDRPANPRTLFTMVKADGVGDLVEIEDPEVEETEDEDEAEAEEALKADIADLTGAELHDTLSKFVSASSRRRMADSGAAMPNGDFPIPDEGHLRSAIGHLGNYTGDKAAAKAHIVSRARALGLTNLLPDDWGIAKADAVLADLATLMPDLTKADDETTDIATAQQAIALIGKLIASEAASMAGGNLGEDGDIACLLDAMRALKYFISCEEQEMEPNPGAAVADSTNMNGDVYMDEADKTEKPTEPVDNGDIAAIVKAAVAEATEPLKGELILVKADLAKALAMPVPGGPAGMRTASQVAAARENDAASLRAQAATLMTKAEAVRRDDPTLAAGYRDQAIDLLSKADA